MEDKPLPKGSFLTVQLVEARNLAAKGHGKNANGSVPYCMITLGGSQTAKSRVHEKTLNPVWNQTFDFLPAKLGDYLYIVVKHKTRALVGLSVDGDLPNFRDDFLGHLSLPMTEFYGKRTVDKWYTLLKNSPKARVSGEIRLKITLGVPGLKYEEEEAPPPSLVKQATALDLAIDEWVITESIKSGTHPAVEDEATAPVAPLEEDDKGKDKGKDKADEAEAEAGSDPDMGTDDISSESESEDEAEEAQWKQREEEAKKRRLAEEEMKLRAEEEEAGREAEAEEAKREKLRQALQAKRLRKIEKEIHDLKEIYDVDTSCLGSSDERCIFLNLHLPVGYPEERPTVELEGSFGDFKEGIIAAFVDYGNEYAANRHKGLVDIVNFFVINYERKFNNAGRAGLAQSAAGRGLLTASNVNGGGRALNRSAWLTASLYVPHTEDYEEEVGEIETSETPTTTAAADGDYDDWDNEGYFFVRNKNDPLELHTKQVQKIFGAYSIHLLRELNEVVIFLEPSFLQEEMAFALGILKDRPITVTLTFQEDYLRSSYLPSVKVEQDENPNFRMRPQLAEITYQFLQQYWPLRFDSAAVLAGIREKITQHEVEAAAVVVKSQAASKPPPAPVAPMPPVAQPSTPPTTYSDALARNLCSYIISGRSYVPQVWYKCLTCTPDGGNQGCCPACAKDEQRTSPFPASSTTSSPPSLPFHLYPPTHPPARRAP
ncbi:uncharacterized protein ACA1_145570 [Acanthamoeba castellanii str. Neff]|uniref:C2 domain-containing protein n=1 Tax=Acanthamoeba castellanii (strain ATCC 30010 / Neff) TaxID=1257118 RepID=L8GCJ2_ACACF|nr:uncharacterized protein ACA1_145570 [Acanthamoeba castellanii str. Neff]ELR10915.1 hypothetical protein ACA1_145570 [Acanthamoeba castellanii str. Neff]